MIEKEGQNIKANEKNYFFKRLSPWQTYLKQKTDQLNRVERKFKEDELQEKAEEDAYFSKLLKFRLRDDLSFLDDPVD